MVERSILDDLEFIRLIRNELLEYDVRIKYRNETYDFLIELLIHFHRLYVIVLDFETRIATCPLTTSAKEELDKKIFECTETLAIV